jgi:mannose/cellobiose epimerase-like protein (N-acyl-D-glucosamine 2-epimerase family)
MDNMSAGEVRAREAHATLSQWLIEAAYPLWAERGFDPVNRVFHERLTAAGPTPTDPHRARVQTRQVYSFARAARLGWQGSAKPLVAAGLEFFLRHYRRPDGLFRTLVAPDGAPLDDRVALYDQAFVLLALATCQESLGAAPGIIAEGVQLRTHLFEKMRRPGGGFDSGIPERLPLLSNPHMHLFEAAQAWSAISDDPQWRALADDLGALALARLIDPGHGGLPEQFDEQWRPLANSVGQAIEPGHLFEWGWLLLCWDAGKGGAAHGAARKLYEIGDRHGVRAGVAINALRADFSIQDAATRLWPQTEWLKASARLAALTGEERYWNSAVSAAQALLRFLAHDTRGLWHDKLTAAGEFLPEPAPATSFYHIICAIAELGEMLKGRP